jgi:hypothetical protein
MNMRGQSPRHEEDKSSETSGIIMRGQGLRNNLRYDYSMRENDFSNLSCEYERTSPQQQLQLLL